MTKKLFSIKELDDAAVLHAAEIYWPTLKRMLADEYSVIDEMCQIIAEIITSGSDEWDIYVDEETHSVIIKGPENIKSAPIEEYINMFADNACDVLLSHPENPWLVDILSRIVDYKADNKQTVLERLQYATVDLGIKHYSISEMYRKNARTIRYILSRKTNDRQMFLKSGDIDQKFICHSIDEIEENLQDYAKSYVWSVAKTYFMSSDELSDFIKKNNISFDIMSNPIEEWKLQK